MNNPNRPKNKAKDKPLVVMIEPDLSNLFTTEEQVNQGLRDLISGMSQMQVFRGKRTSHSLLHDFKHELFNWQNDITRAIETTSNNRRLSIIRRVSFEISTRIKKLTDEIGNQISTEDVVEINQTILEVVRYYALQLRRDNLSNIVITPELLNEIPALYLNKSDIWEVISNLISNAITSVMAANRADGQIYVRSDILEKEIPYVRIAIQDNGVGIENKIKNRIFDKGFTTRENGTGLGLYIISQIIEDHYGGSIIVESKIGKGTTFHVLIPKVRYEFQLAT